MLREVANGLFALGWTAGLAGTAVAKHAVTGDAGLVHAWTPLWARGLARAWGMPVRAFGCEHIVPGQTHVFMSNHQSHVDIVALMVALPTLPGFLAKKELRSVPFLGAAMEVGGHVFIDRQRRTDALKVIDGAAEQVRDGKSIVIFPEGTRSDGAAIYRFKKGGFHLARKAGVPVVPVGLRGTSTVLPKHGSLLRGAPVEVHIGEPVPAHEVSAMPVQDLMARVRSAICELSGLPPADQASAST
jgi:1-acyl-sn-glycerol-3-phosphate acyltransferase